MRRQVAIYLTVLFFVVPNISWALVVGANNGSITFSEQTVGAARAGVPLFDVNGKLIGPGGGFKDLNPPTPPQQGVAGAIAPPLAAVAVPGGIGTGQFGAGAMKVQAVGFANGGGIFWGPGFVADAATNNIASVVDSTGAVTLFNNGPVPFVGFGGGWLAVQGHLGGPGEYVAASLTGSIGNIPFVPIVIAADGLGGALDGVLSAGTASAFLPTINGLDFLAWGVSIIPGVFNIPVGGNITLQGTLTLAADPMSSIIFVDLPAGVPKPDFGVGAVPEPATILLFVLGLFAILKFIGIRRRETNLLAPSSNLVMA